MFGLLQILVVSSSVLIGPAAGAAPGVAAEPGSQAGRRSELTHTVNRLIDLSQSDPKAVVGACDSLLKTQWRPDERAIRNNAYMICAIGHRDLEPPNLGLAADLLMNLLVEIDSDPVGKPDALADISRVERSNIANAPLHAAALLIGIAEKSAHSGLPTIASRACSCVHWVRDRGRVDIPLAFCERADQVDDEYDSTCRPSPPSNSQAESGAGTDPPVRETAGKTLAPPRSAEVGDAASPKQSGVPLGTRRPSADRLTHAGRPDRRRAVGIALVASGTTLIVGGAAAAVIASQGEKIARGRIDGPPDPGQEQFLEQDLPRRQAGLAYSGLGAALLGVGALIPGAVLWAKARSRVRAGVTLDRRTERRGTTLSPGLWVIGEF